MDTQCEESLLSEMAARASAPPALAKAPPSAALVPTSLQSALETIIAQNAVWRPPAAVAAASSSGSLGSGCSKGITPAAVRQNEFSFGTTGAGPKLFPKGAPPPFGVTKVKTSKMTATSTTATNPTQVNQEETPPWRR